MVQRRGPVYGDYEDIFRRHYEKHHKSAEYPFERYEVAYSFGYDLARPQQPDKWIEVEDEARQRWKEQQSGSWEEFKESIQYAWERAKEAMSG